MIRSPLNRLSIGYELTLADRLFRLGARPPVVCSLCHIGKKTAIRLYKTILQQSPKQGLLPYDAYWIVRSSGNNSHASIFLGLIDDFSEQQSQTDFNTEAFITAYELYCQVVANNLRPSKQEASAPQSVLLNINRAWQLAGQLNAKEMALVICDKCHARYVVLSSMPKPFQQCPICDVWADKTGRRRWTTVNTRPHD
ncbi:MAG: FlhC family transcriptional regulator [Methylovulum miyakonense]|uniref:FlhC family transcriptional regulator n=1 Tax=Methylovulum miyakonense TaxID=645578 RepID=UPI003BB80343